MERWLRRSGAPDLRLEGVRRTKDVVRGHLLQTTSPPFDGAVDIGAIDGRGNLLGLTRVSFSTRDTSFELPVLGQARRVVLDPRFRLPRKGAAGPDQPPSVPIRGKGTSR
jgi:hypothetical protein